MKLLLKVLWWFLEDLQELLLNSMWWGYLRISLIRGFTVIFFELSCVIYVIFLYRSPKLIDLYLHMKFQVYISSSSEVMKLFKDIPYSRIYGSFFKKSAWFVFFYRSPQLIDLYLHMKFQVDIIISSGIMRLF